MYVVTMQGDHSRRMDIAVSIVPPGHLVVHVRLGGRIIARCADVTGCGNGTFRSTSFSWCPNVWPNRMTVQGIISREIGLEVDGHTFQYFWERMTATVIHNMGTLLCT